MAKLLPPKNNEIVTAEKQIILTNPDFNIYKGGDQYFHDKTLVDIPNLPDFNEDDFIPIFLKVENGSLKKDEKGRPVPNDKEIIEIYIKNLVKEHQAKGIKIYYSIAFLYKNREYYQISDFDKYIKDSFRDITIDYLRDIVKSVEYLQLKNKSFSLVDKTGIEKLSQIIEIKEEIIQDKLISEIELEEENYSVDELREIKKSKNNIKEALEKDPDKKVKQALKEISDLGTDEEEKSKKSLDFMISDKGISFMTKNKKIIEELKKTISRKYDLKEKSA